MFFLRTIFLPVPRLRKMGSVIVLCSFAIFSELVNLLHTPSKHLGMACHNAIGQLQANSYQSYKQKKKTPQTPH